MRSMQSIVHVTTPWHLKVNMFSMILFDFDDGCCD